MHVIFSVPIRFLLEKTTSSIYTLSQKHNLVATDDNYKIKKFILDSSGDIVSIFGFLIYLEIIELRCKKCNHNYRNNIAGRGIRETTNNLTDDTTISEDEDSLRL